MIFLLAPILIIVIGKIGQESAAARFAATTASSDFLIESEKPYAEVRSVPFRIKRVNA